MSGFRNFDSWAAIKLIVELRSRSGISINLGGYLQHSIGKLLTCFVKQLIEAGKEWNLQMEVVDQHQMRLFNFVQVSTRHHISNGHRDLKLLNQSWVVWSWNAKQQNIYHTSLQNSQHTWDIPWRDILIPFSK